MEYWSFMWGTVVMALSGFLLWLNNFSLWHFPKHYRPRYYRQLVREGLVEAREPAHGDD